MRRTLTGIACFVSVMLVLALVWAQENDAEKLFHAMERKARAAKSLNLLCELEGTFDGSGAPMKITASKQFAGANQARFEMRVEGGGNVMERLQVSDGKTMLVRESDGAETAPKPAPPNLNKNLPAAIAWGGFMLPRLVIPDGEDGEGFNADQLLPASDFQLGAKERIGDVETQAVEYSVKFGGRSFAFGGRTAVRVTVWIDPKALVPLKRKVVDPERKDHFFVEVYREFVPDAQLDAKVFDLPK